MALTLEEVICLPDEQLQALGLTKEEIDGIRTPLVPPPPKLPPPQEGPQTLFMESAADIVIYGGAAGGGKTFALLIDFAREEFIKNPAYGFVIFRRESPQITNEGGLWDASQIYRSIGGESRVGDHSWRFPAGCSGRFSHLANEDDKYNWQGSEITRIGFDELLHFTETQFFYLISRNRSTCGIRPQVRATCNPGPGWVKKFLAPWIDKKYPNPAKSAEIRYFARLKGDIQWVDKDFRIPLEDIGDVSKYDTDTIEEMRRPKSVTFIRSSVQDNPALVKSNPAYLANLLSQGAIDRARLLDGDWDAFEGSFFDTFNPVEHVVPAWHTPKTVDGPIPPQWWKYFGGFDWGYNDPSAFVLQGIDENGAIHTLESWEAQRMTNEQYADKVCLTLARWGIAKRDCLIYADGTMWNKKTVNAVPAPADVEAFYAAGLTFVKGDVGDVANRHRNSAIRDFLNVPKKFFVYRGYNERLIECLTSAQPAKHDNEQVLHDDSSHLIAAVGHSMASRPVSSTTPPAILSPDEKKAEAQKEYEETNRLAEEARLIERNKSQDLAPKRDDKGELLRDDKGNLQWVQGKKAR